MRLTSDAKAGLAATKGAKETRAFTPSDFMFNFASLTPAGLAATYSHHNVFISKSMFCLAIPPLWIKADAKARQTTTRAREYLLNILECPTDASVAVLSVMSDQSFT